MENRQVVIVGAGPAGLSAAIYTRRSGLDTLVLEKGLSGGQINITAEIENYPGFKHAGGMELAKALRDHAEKFGPEFRDCKVEALALDGGEKIVRTNKGGVSADSVIIASGASFSKAGCKGEIEFAGRGVSYCAVCDGAFFEDAPVAVIGGGNTAVEEAVYLTQFASKVYIVHRRDEFRANKTAIERALANPKIEPVMGCVVDEIAGSDMVEKIVVRRLTTGEIRDIAVEGVFVFVGTNPNIDFLADDDRINRAGNGWIVTNEQMETSVEGVFAAGDVRDKFLRQVVTAAGDGATAGMAAYEYLSNQYYMKSALIDPERVVALFISSIDAGHLTIAREAEELLKNTGRKVVTVDAHRNVRMREKLGVGGIPAAVELARGNKIREALVASAHDVKAFCDECFG
jgi:thioredoxin reductase (NADPH)